MGFNLNKCLCFTALQNNCRISLANSPVDNSHYYFSKDGQTWTPDEITINIDEKAYVKGTNYPAVGYKDEECRCFNCLQKYNLSGNIMSLIDDGAGELKEITQPYGFYGLFTGSTVNTIADGFLPATVLTPHCYEKMFILSSITTVGKFLLPANELKEGCYDSMFYQCENLNSPIKIFAHSYAKNSCHHMFYLARKFNHLIVDFDEWNNESHSYWLAYTSETGTFDCSEFLEVERGVSAIPNNWEIKHHKIPSKINIMKGM